MKERVLTDDKISSLRKGTYKSRIYKTLQNSRTQAQRKT